MLLYRRSKESRARRVHMGLALLVALAFLGSGLLQAWWDAPTYDEPVYISSGLAALYQHDVMINEEHPPGWKVLAVLPTVLARPAVPPVEGSSEAAYASRFMAAQAASGRLRLVVFLSRLVPLLEALAVAAVLFRLAGALFGQWAAVTACVLWLADPVVEGLGHLDGVDLPLALAASSMSLVLLHALRDPRPRWRWGLGVLGGVAVLASAEGGVLFVAAGLVATAHSWPDGPEEVTRRLRWAFGQFGRIVAAAWATILSCYGVLDPASLMPALVLPTPLVDGLRFLAVNDTLPAPAYLLGRSWVGGRWWYWPLSLLVKVPLSTLALAAIGLAAWRLADPVRRLEAFVVAVLPAVVLAVLLLAVRRDIGVRYALPVVALGCVAASAVALLPASVRAGRRPPADRSRAFPAAGITFAVIALVVSSVAETVRSTPHSLSWVNPMFGPSYQAVSNSSGDWGQDFYVLQRWAAGKAPLVAFPSLWVTRADLPGARPLLIRGTLGPVSVPAGTIRGWVAVSATALTSDDPEALSWLRAYCPVRVLAGTILIYRFVTPPSPRPGPPRPTGRCSGPVSHRG